MTEMLKIVDQEFQSTLINVMRTLMAKVDSIQELIGNVSREMEILRKNYKEMLGIKNTNRNEESL